MHPLNAYITTSAPPILPRRPPTKVLGVHYSQLIGTSVVSVAAAVFTAAFFRSFDAGCCSSKTMGLAGGVVMVVYAVLQVIAFSFAIAFFNEGERCDFCPEEPVDGCPIPLELRLFLISL